MLEDFEVLEVLEVLSIKVKLDVGVSGRKER